MDITIYSVLGRRGRDSRRSEAHRSMSAFLITRRSRCIRRPRGCAEALVHAGHSLLQLPPAAGIGRDAFPAGHRELNQRHLAHETRVALERPSEAPDLRNVSLERVQRSTPSSTELGAADPGRAGGHGRCGRSSGPFPEVCRDGERGVEEEPDRPLHPAGPEFFGHVEQGVVVDPDRPEDAVGAADIVPIVLVDTERDRIEGEPVLGRSEDLFDSGFRQPGVLGPSGPVSATSVEDRSHGTDQSPPHSGGSLTCHRVFGRVEPGAGSKRK